MIGSCMSPTTLKLLSAVSTNKKATPVIRVASRRSLCISLVDSNVDIYFTSTLYVCAGVRVPKRSMFLGVFLLIIMSYSSSSIPLSPYQNQLKR